MHTDAVSASSRADEWSHMASLAEKEVKGRAGAHIQHEEGKNWGDVNASP